MRAEFVAELAALARTDSRVILLTADLGFSIIEQYVDEFPDRFVNVGVAEQNMMGLATGLAREGYTPFTYSIATFASMRPYEIIRNGPALHNLPVRIVGAGGGFDYGHGGITHYALEDIAILRAQPRVAIAVPADADQARAALRASASHPGPIYFRIGRESRPVAGLGGRFAFGRLEVVRASPEMSVAFLACGPIAHEAVAAAASLEERGISAGVAVVSTFNPFPTEGVREFVESAALVVTVESHYRTGGLGSATAEVMAECGSRARLLRMGIQDMPTGSSGSPAYMLEQHGLTSPRSKERSYVRWPPRDSERVEIPLESGRTSPIEGVTDPALMGRPRKRVTIVTCAYNEEDCIDELIRRLVATFDELHEYQFDVVAVDNGSHDATLEKLLKARANDERIAIVELSRNFKTDGGLLAGLSVATGDAVILMAADLQDPPEIIPRLLEKWEEGYENVYPVIRKRLEMGWLRRTNSHLFYWVIGRVSEQPIPADANDFRLLDRRVYESVRDMDERNRFLRGLVVWSGFRSVGVDYDRPDRYAGKSKAYSLLVMELALRAILAHTLKPLAAAPIVGSGLSLAGIVTLVCVFATWVAGSPVHLTGVIVGCSLLVSGVLFALVGVIGMYVGLIYEQVRGRPNYVVRNLIGIESPGR